MFQRFQAMRDSVSLPRSGRCDMTATAILERLTELGVKTTVHGDRLRFTPGSRIPPDLVEANKP